MRTPHAVSRGDTALHASRSPSVQLRDHACFTAPPDSAATIIPEWFTILSIVMLALGGLCALIIAIDLMLGHKQHMWIMNIVWPVTALFGTVFAVWAYFKYGRLATHKRVMEAQQRGEDPPKYFTIKPMRDLSPMKGLVQAVKADTLSLTT